MKKLILNNFKKLMSMMLTAILLLSTISFEVFAKNPKVSIIIPVYNTPENLLRDCLESAKNQTLKDIEIICVDDGSTNGSGKILDEYEKDDPRFVVVHQENGGTCVARDNGMGLAKGEYIQFLDHDDTIDPTMSEKCYNAAKEYDADIVKCGYDGAICKRDFKDFFGVMPKFKFFNDQRYVYIWDGLYKKSYLDRYNISFKGLYAYSEDIVFNLMCVMQEHKLVCINAILYHHLMFSNNFSTICRQNPNNRQICEINNLKCLFEKINNEHPGCSEYINFFMKYAKNKGSLNAIKSGFYDKVPKALEVKKNILEMRSNPKLATNKTIDDGIYAISSKLAPNMCLDINQCSKDDKANLQLWQKNGTNAQKFKIQYNPDGYYTIKAMCSGKFIDVSASGKQNGTNIWQYIGNGTDAQKWFIVPDGEGFYYLVSKCNNLCMDVCGAKATNGANIHCWSIHAGDNQRFKLEKCEGKLSSSKPNKAQKLAGKPRPHKPVRIKRNVDKSNSSKPGNSKKSA